jgi:alkylation response protein AidB-like acyl-CoA dehydrogenase
VRAAIEKICARFGDDYWLKRDSDGNFPEEFYRALADDGWLGVCIPQAYGGSGLGVKRSGGDDAGGRSFRRRPFPARPRFI